MKNESDKIVNQMISDLISIGQETTEVLKMDKKWTFKILSADEHLKTIADSAYYNDPLARIFKMQVEVLKESIISINDTTLSKEEKSELFSKVNPTIIDILYNEYESIKNKKEKAILDIDKKAPKK